MARTKMTYRPALQMKTTLRGGGTVIDQRRFRRDFQCLQLQQYFEKMRKDNDTHCSHLACTARENFVPLLEGLARDVTTRTGFTFDAVIVDECRGGAGHDAHLQKILEEQTDPNAPMAMLNVGDARDGLILVPKAVGGSAARTTNWNFGCGDLVLVDADARRNYHAKIRKPVFSDDDTLTVLVLVKLRDVETNVSSGGMKRARPAETSVDVGY